MNIYYKIMASPRKKNINIQPEIAYRDLKYKYWNDVTRNNGFLPQSVLHEDIDKGVIEFFNKLPLVSGDEKIPVIFLTLQRWGEFTKTWEFTDEFDNIKIPFLSIVRQPNVELKEGNFTIPDRKTFPFIKLPIWDGNRKGLDIYKIPQPTPIIMKYQISFFTTKMREVNLVNKIISQKFSSRQSYILVNGHYFPLLWNGTSDESQIENDSKRFYHITYEIDCESYLLDTSEFERTEIVPTLNRAFLTTELTNTTIRRPVFDKNGNDITLYFYFQVPITSTFTFLDSNYKFLEVETENISSFQFKINNINVDLPFEGSLDSQLSISIVKVDSSQQGKIILKGIDFGSIS
jgi:hypothetical protein